MTGDDLDREVLALFEALLEAEPENSDEWLAQRASGRPELLASVRQLLDADRQALLQTGGAVRLAGETPPPERLGGYRIGERIGAGGMGSGGGRAAARRPQDLIEFRRPG